MKKEKIWYHLEWKYLGVGDWEPIGHLQVDLSHAKVSLQRFRPTFSDETKFRIAKYKRVGVVK